MQENPGSADDAPIEMTHTHSFGWDALGHESQERGSLAGDVTRRLRSHYAEWIWEDYGRTILRMKARAAHNQTTERGLIIAEKS